MLAQCFQFHLVAAEACDAPRRLARRPYRAAGFTFLSSFRRLCLLSMCRDGEGEKKADTAKHRGCFCFLLLSLAAAFRLRRPFLTRVLGWQRIFASGFDRSWSSCGIKAIQGGRQTKNALGVFSLRSVCQVLSVITLRVAGHFRTARTTCYVNECFGDYRHVVEVERSLWMLTSHFLITHAHFAPRPHCRAFHVSVRVPEDFLLLYLPRLIVLHLTIYQWPAKGLA